MREIHFYSAIQYIPEDVKPIHTYDSLRVALEADTEVLHTTQMCFLSSELWYSGYTIVMHDISGTYVLLPNGTSNRIRKPLTASDDLFTMWKNGEFDIRED